MRISKKEQEQNLYIPEGLSDDDLRSLKKNDSGCPDPTAYEAIVNVMNEEMEKERFHKLLKTVFNLCELSGFYLEEHIVVKDKRTGRIWR